MPDKHPLLTDSPLVFPDERPGVFLSMRQGYEGWREMAPAGSGRLLFQGDLR
jgi:hypothetical protein